MNAIVAREPSQIGTRDVLRAVWIAAFGGSLPDGRKKNWRIGVALQAVMAACVLFNVTLATLGAAAAGELYVSGRAMCTIGRRGPHRSLRSRLGAAVPAALMVLLMGVPGVVAGLVSGVRTGDPIRAIFDAASTSSWVLAVILLWVILGVLVHFGRTHAYKHSYRTGVPKSHWLLGQTAALRGGDGFGFADSTAQQLVDGDGGSYAYARAHLCSRRAPAGA